LTTRERPGVILILALVNVAVGSLCIFAGVASLGKLLLLAALPMEPPPVPVPVRGGIYDRVEYEQLDLPAFLDKKLPGYSAIEGFANLGLLLAGTLLVVAGIGLLHMRRWARWGGVFYSLMTLVCQPSYAFYRLAFVLPLLELYQRQDTTRYYWRGNSAESYALGFVFFLGLQVGLLILHALTQLVILALPSVGAAFTGTAEEMTPVTPAYGNGMADEQRHIQVPEAQTVAPLMDQA
jgi:hypothetical protein